MTDAELKLWNAVRAHRLLELGFRRQFPVADYIVDFACPERRLIVEVDGAQHNDPETQAYDARRTAFMEQSGWTVLRITNNDVLKDIEDVCNHIVIASEERSLQ